MLFLVVSLCLATVTLTSGEMCSADAEAKSARCSRLYGLNDDVLTSERPIYGHPLMNISVLLDYCRTADPPDIGQCERQAMGGCDLGWGEEGRIFFDRTHDRARDGVDYLCAQQNILERDQDCLEGISNRIVRCAQDGWRIFATEVRTAGDSLSWDIFKGFMEKLSRVRERCITRAIKKRCNFEVAAVFRNYFYIATIAPFEETQDFLESIQPV